MSAKTRQWILPKEGAGIDALVLREGVEVPASLPPKHYLVHMKALSINYRDKIICTATGLRTKDNVILLSDGAGEVAAVGPDAHEFAKGDRVAIHMCPGYLAESQVEGAGLPPSRGGDVDGVAADYVVVNELDLLHIPAYMTYEEAATLPCAGVTAWTALNRNKGGLRPGSTVLIQGTGGVSVLAGQLAAAAGCRVIALISSEEKKKRLVDLGIVAEADCINYRTTPKWGAAVRALTAHEQGVDIVVDVVGPSSINECFEAVRRNGVVSSLGLLDPTLPPEGLNYHALLMKQIMWKGLLVGPKKDFQDVLDLAAQRQIHFVADQRVFSFRELKEALQYLAAGKHTGKIVIRVD